ncbi:hypothetical protein L227DRAFT_425632 [Lentinus tigrinus ALCF2SS1-6]|uniref:Uncharacterized protein n=1 Tax=Lentinus tigrinus ALCF2SS1-6 TaxID=1328759 RepID=A0A5C2RMS8_9APHY|nr:hypothetical protein L227DRAFT_425632 [Lentinus tigrinus ALCF2SS1-6]
MVSLRDPVPPNAISAIRFLTSFLHGLEPLDIRPDGTVQPVQPLKVPRPSNAITPYAHLATMLNLGYPKTMVVAVTGCLHPDQEPKAVIVISSNSGDQSESKVNLSRGENYFLRVDTSSSSEYEPGFAVQTITPSELTVESVRENSTEKVHLMQHVADVVAVLRLASVPMPSPEDGVAQYALDDGHVCNWIHARCYRKIYHCIMNNKREWPDQGLAKVLESWVPQESDRGSLKARDIQIPQQFADALKLCGFECRRMLENCFVAGKRLKLGVPASKLNHLVGGLNFIIHLKEVKDVITKSSLSKHVRDLVYESRQAKLFAFKMPGVRPAEDEAGGQGERAEHQAGQVEPAEPAGQVEVDDVEADAEEEREAEGEGKS